MDQCRSLVRRVVIFKIKAYGPPPPPGFGATNTKTHDVKRGDSVWKVAKDHGMTVDELLLTPGNEHLKAGSR